MEQLKQTELALLRAFVRACEALGLRYYVLGGTLLGAVRHKGFIPWDDDVDVCMPRADYDRFMAQGQAQLPKDYFLQNYETDPEYPFGFAKIRDDRTTFIETSVKNLRIHHGVYIDIFPLDNVPAGSQRRFRVRSFLMKIRANYGLNVKPSFKVRALQQLTRLRWPEARDAVRQREALFRGVEASGLWGNMYGAWGKKEIAPAAWFGEGVPLPFEELTVIAPVNYDAWLTQVYGDYMQPPPPEKQVGHHGYEILDLERPYTFYCKSNGEEEKQ